MAPTWTGGESIRWPCGPHVTPVTVVLGVVTLFICASSVSSVEVTDELGGAGEPLHCHVCHSIYTTDDCKNGSLIQNTTEWEAQCSAKQNFCMVRAYKSSSTVNVTEALTSIWSVERKCAEQCEPVCLTIGERTKIISCTSCCTHHLCNYGDAAADLRRLVTPLFWLSLAAAAALR